VIGRRAIGERNREVHAELWHWVSSWHGVPLYKYATDLQVYREIIERTRPDLIVETGVLNGGSLLFFASTMADLGIDGSVVGIDVDLTRVVATVAAHPRVTLLEGSSTGRGVLAQVRALAAGRRVMVVLDSDHRSEHVLDELRAYSGLVTPGCYLVAEDTTIDVFGVVPGHGPGPFVALDRWLAESPPFDVDTTFDRLVLTTSPCGRLRRRSSVVTVHEVPGRRPTGEPRTAFAVPIGNEQTWNRWSRIGIDRCARPGDVVIELRENTCMFAAGNAAFDAALAVDDLGALVLQHDDVELQDPDVGAKLRSTFADGTVGVAGVIGSRMAPVTMAWWEGEPLGQVRWRLRDPRARLGTADLVGERPLGAGALGRADVVDGLLLAFSPDAIRRLRFDETLGPSFHGYDADIALQARVKGIGVAVVDLACTHHNNADFPYLDGWAAQFARFEAKWSARRPATSGADAPP
jgi:cephalosporin hydroxylase